MHSGIHDSYILKSSGTIDIFSTEQVTTNIDLEIAPVLTLQLSGYVRERFQEGNGIEDAVVLVYTKDNEFLGKTRTDGIGYFFFSNLPAGACKLTAYKDGYQTLPLIPVMLEAGIPAAQDLVLPPEGSRESLIYGRVTATDETPLEGVRVCVMDEEGRTVACTATTPRGEYATYGLPDGTYSVMFSAQGYTSRRFDLSVSGTSKLHNRNAALQPVNAPSEVAAISGFITNSQGAPLANAWVGLYTSTNGNHEELLAVTTTTGDGFYIFTPVRPGQYTVKSKAMVM